MKKTVLLFLFTVLQLNATLSLAKAPPCVQWYGACEKTQVREQYFAVDDSTISYTRATIHFEERGADGAVVERTASYGIKTDKWGAPGAVLLGIPNLIGFVSEKAALSAACKNLKKVLEQRACN